MWVNIVILLIVSGQLHLSLGSRLRTDCLNGSEDEKCAHSGTCRRMKSKSSYFAGGEARKTAAYSYTYCACTREWGGVTCREPNTCFHTQPCTPGHFQHCVHRSPNSFKCICFTKWTGKLCESPRSYTLQLKASENPCRSSPCGSPGGKYRRGSCLVRHNSTGHYSGYECKCNERYTGVHCETLRDCRHDSDGCKNGGSCLKTNRYQKAYLCKCPDDFTGFRCEHQVPDIEDPSSAPVAPPDAKRQRLSSNSGPCASSPCRQAATCYEIREDTSGLIPIQEPVAYRCECPDDSITECNSPSVDDFIKFENLISSCLRELSGIPQYLDILGFDETPALSHGNMTVRKFRSLGKGNPCKNNGICIIELNKMRCYCPVGVKGKLCSIQTGPKIEMNLQFQNTFEKSLLDKSSNKSLKLKEGMKLWVSTTCVEDMGAVCHLTDVSFAPGSISAKYSVTFGNELLGKRLAVSMKLGSLLRKNAEKFPDKSMTVVPNSVKVTQVNQPQSVRKSSKNKVLAVMVVCTGLAFPLALAVGISFLLKRNYRPKNFFYYRRRHLCAAPF